MSVQPVQPMPLLAPIVGATHLAIPEWLWMPTDRFLRILERVERRQRPHGEWCLVALSLCLAFLFPLVTTASFKPLLGFKPEMWEAFCLLGACVFGALTVGLSARWVYLKFKTPTKTAEQILAEVMDQMRREQDQASARSSRAPAAAAPASGAVSSS